jgi:hypothetical protein
MSVDLLPREAYDADESVDWNRAGWTFGLLFGGLMWLVFAVVETGVLNLVGRTDILWAVLAANTVLWVVGGATGGFLWGRLSRAALSKWMDRLYARDSELVAPGDEEARYRYRLLANWMSSPNFAVGGTLYIGEPGIAFVAHRVNLPRHRGPVLLGPRETVALRLVPRRHLAAVRLLARTLSDLIEVTSETGSAQFALPQPEWTMGLIERALRESGRRGERALGGQA